jgi:phosphatidate cytidylyltransferase
LKNLLVRTLTGIVFTVVIVGGLLLGQATYAILFTLILLGATFEFLKMSKTTGVSPSIVLTLTCVSLVFLTFFLTGMGFFPITSYFVLSILLLLIFIVELYRKKEKPFENIAASLFCLVYVALPLSLTTFLVFNEAQYSPSLLLAIFALIWTYDSGAYLFGVSLGKHRLFERISPKKSWEGAVGGGLSAIGISWVISEYFLPEIGLAHWIGIALITVVFATLGDLAESLLKRQFKVKDSGNFLPGHGGILDRFDSLLFVAPAVVVYLKVFV